jgi:glycosyltransferase involved in cell wall biosynthesis
MEQKTICHISYHDAFDDRIYWKQLLSLKEYGFKTVHIIVGDADADFYSDQGIRIISIKRKKFSKSVSINRLLQLVFKKRGVVAKILKTAAAINANVYHYHDLQLNALSKKLKQLPQKPKVIYDAHEAYYMLWKEREYANFFTRSISQSLAWFISKWELKQAAYCDYIITTDEHTEQYFKKHLPSIPSSIVFNYSFFIPLKQEQIDEKKYHFIYTGLISKTRGVDEIIKAISSFKVFMPSVKALIIGPFETEQLKNEIAHYIINSRLQHNIELKSPVPFTEMPLYYNQSSIGLGLFRSTPKYNSFMPIKLFEYMAFGLPVIFSDQGPSAKIIKEANCGLLVNTNNIESVVEAMRALIANKELYFLLSENGKKAVATKYNWEKEKHKLLAIYNQLLKHL